VPARLIRFGSLRAGEAVMLELPVGRSPPQGAILELDARLQRPRPASHGFDERTWLRRHGIHVVVVLTTLRVRSLKALGDRASTYVEGRNARSSGPCRRSQSR
jgi:hypothetical protein